MKTRSRKEADKQYRALHRAEIRERRREYMHHYQQTHKAAHKNAIIKYRKKHPESYHSSSCRMKIWRLDNPEKSREQYKRARARNIRKLPLFESDDLSPEQDRVWEWARNEFIRQVLVGKQTDWALSGCTVERLRLCIYTQFQPGMNWGTWGKNWQIVFSTPLSSFDLEKNLGPALSLSNIGVNPIVTQTTKNRKRLERRRKQFPRFAECDLESEQHEIWAATREKLIWQIANGRGGLWTTAGGVTVDRLKDYIEKQFQPGMKWWNWGEVWQIGFANPLNDYDLSTELEEALRLSNLKVVTLNKEG
jgi:hypothetical protein